MRPGSACDLAARSRGFTLLVMLCLLAALGVGLALAGPAWRDRVLREREAEWLRVGALYAQALDSYVQSAPGAIRQLPARVEDLLLDTRFVGVRRHLRQAYNDPLQPTQPWQILRDEQGRIVGFFSSLQAEPFIAQPPAGMRVQLRADGTGYSRWAFVVSLPPSNASGPLQ